MIMSSKTRHILERVIGAFLILVLSGILALQIPSVQEGIARRILDRFNATFPGHIDFSHIRLLPSGTLKLQDVILIDRKPYMTEDPNRQWARADTVFYAKDMSVTFALRSIYDHNGLHLNRVIINGGLFHLTTEPGPPGRIRPASNLERLFGPAKEPPLVPVAGPSIFNIKQVRISEFTFFLNSYLDRPFLYRGKGINFEDMAATAHLLRAKNLKMTGGIMSGLVEHLQASEKSGFVLDHLEGYAKVGMGKTIIDDLKIISPGTNLKFDSFSMSYANALEFADFVNKVSFDAVARSSLLSMKTISYFAGGAFDYNDIALDLHELDVHGPVCDLNIRNLDFIDNTSGVRGKISGKIAHLPSAPDMTLEMNIRDVSFMMPQAAGFINSWSNGNGKLDFGNLAEGCHMVMNAETSGCINSFKVRADINTGGGKLHADILLKNLINTKPIGIDLKVSSDGIDAGKILGTGELGDAAFVAKAGMLLDPEGVRINADTLLLRKAVVHGSRYDRLFASAKIEEGELQARAECSDKDLSFRARVRMDMGNDDSRKRYKADLNVKRADLAAMNLIGKEKTAIVALRFNLDGARETSGIYTGNAEVRDFSLEDLSGISNMGRINIAAAAVDSLQSIKLTSPLLDADYLGSHDFPSIVCNLEDKIARKHLPALFDSPRKDVSDTPFHLKMSFHETMEYLSRIVPGLYIANKTLADVNFASDGSLDAVVKSPRLAYGFNFFKDADLKVNSSENILTANLGGSELFMGRFGVKSPLLKAGVGNGEFDLSMSFNETSHTKSIGNIVLEGKVERDDNDSLQVSLRSENSRIVTPKGTWAFSDDGIHANKKSLRVHSFQVRNGLQSISLDGALTHSKKDTLTLRLDSLDLSAANSFLPGNHDIRGRIDGILALISTLDDKTNFKAGMLSNGLFIGNTPAGSLAVNADLDNDIGEMNVSLEGNSQGRKTISAYGIYRIDEETASLDAEFDRMPLAVAAPFLSDIFTRIDGTLDGSLQLDGPVKKLTTESSRMEIRDGLMQLVSTGVAYKLDGPFRIENGGIFLDDMRVRDEQDGKASLSGSLNYKDLKNIKLDAGITFNNLLVLNIPEHTNADLYGKMKASGNASVTGPVNALCIEGNVSSSGEGDLHVPLSGSLSSTRSDILSFKEMMREKDSYQIMLDEYHLAENKKTNSDIRIKGKVNLTPTTKAYLEIDKTVGNVMSLGGRANINLDMRPAKNQFNLSGDYDINEGKYHFVIPGLMDKELNIENGSTLKFGGDLMDSQIDITAKYKLKTSLSTLISDTTKVYSRRPVECGLRISDKLRSPSLNFFINVPDLEPNMKSQVESALNTDDKVQKQFVSLLLFGSFLPSEQSGVFNGTNMLYSNLGEVVSSQFNNILQKLDIPLDFGFGYQETQAGNNMFDVAVSTQLFNNRVEVKGNLGNRKYKTSGNGLVGDLDIEVKLDKTGRFRMSLFSHSADDYTNFLDNSQRNGLGVSYNRDFDTFKELMKSIFTPKSKRISMEPANVETKKKIISIDESNRKAIPDPGASGR